MSDLKNLSRAVPGHDLKLLGSAPYVYHCHHFNLFHDQTVEDALGPEEAFEVRCRAARRASRHLLADAVRMAGAATPIERLQLAASIFRWMGQGDLELLAGADGGAARGNHLHYGFAWREKYGAKVRRKVPIDAFAAGYASAATEVAFDLEPGSLCGRETSCFACREPGCEFSITTGGEGDTTAPVDAAGVERRVGTPGAGIGEERIAAITQGLNDFLLGVGPDERGLVQGFGIYVTRHLSGYYDQTAYDTIHFIEQHAPQATAAVEGLFGESGHVCVFYTFGNLLLSPEWEGLVGPVRGEVEEVVTSCTAIARALGFGHWTISELVPGERLVLRTASNYEFPFYLERYGRSAKPRCYFFANAARAFMQLAHRVDWPAKPALTEDLYQNLFKQGLSWHTEETCCCARGDDHCEVVVTRRS
ncbi:MAG: hypothetical protein KDD11_11660 [Acidobacteria bacterium]|nr:hypothetical protein [Acidobacteriota bacterium]